MSWGLEGATPRKSPRKAVIDVAFLEDITHWVEHDRGTARKLLRIMREVLRDPFVGTGKPEPLKHKLSGAWSRRLTKEHRLVYAVTEETVIFLQARIHYK